MSEVHEHYDTDGNPTGHTVITRESPWDADARARAMRLAEYERSMCACGCGLPIKIAYDKKQAFMVDHSTCQAGRALDRVRREQAADAEKSKLPAGWADGRHYYVTPVETPTREGGK